MLAVKSASAATKYSAPAAGVAVAEYSIGGIDLVTAGAIIVGLIAGAVLRNSRFVSEDAGWREIRKDLLVSMMSGMANFIIAGITVAAGSFAIPGFPVLAAAGVGLFFGHQGPDAINWFNRKFFGHSKPDEPVHMTPPHNQELDRLAHRLDEGEDK